MNICPNCGYDPNEEFEGGEQHMLIVNGHNFRCTCGCNVFTKSKTRTYRARKYKCNSCGAIIVGEITSEVS